MLENQMGIAVGLIITLLALAGIFRFRLIRRTRPKLGIVWQVYDEFDLCPCKLVEISKADWPPENFNINNGYLDGENWEVQYKVRRSRRLFFLNHCLEVLHEAHERLKKQKGLYFRTHFLCMAALFAALSLKGLFRPSGDDIRLLIGFDSLAAERLCWLRENERLLAVKNRKKSTIS